MAKLGKKTGPLAAALAVGALACFIVIAAVPDHQAGEAIQAADLAKLGTSGQ